MGELRILGPNGDERVSWDVECKEDVQAAERIFAERMLNGFLAFRMDEGNSAILKEFDPKAKRILLSPPIGGG